LTVQSAVVAASSQDLTKDERGLHVQDLGLHFAIHNMGEWHWLLLLLLVDVHGLTIAAQVHHNGGWPLAKGAEARDDDCCKKSEGNGKDDEAEVVMVMRCRRTRCPLGLNPDRP